MLTRPRTALLLAAMVLGFGLQASGVARAQDQTLALRMSNMEERMRELNGQIEELTIKLKQLNDQIQRFQKESEYRLQGLEGQPGKQQAAAQGEATDLAQGEQPLPDPNGVERISPDNELSAYQTGELDQLSAESADGSGEGVIEKAPGPKPLGTLPQGTNNEGDQALNGPPALNSGGDTYAPNEVETASLDQGSMAAASPEQLYERAYESLLRRRYGEAEAGFRTFVDKHADHDLAGNAEFWLGETYYVQSDYKQAAQAFLAGYQNYPQNRKAPDSLLRLGMSLQKLGQKDQACAAFSTVGTKFPKAAETLKRAQNESTKAGC